MADFFVYIDETGTLDFLPPRSPTESPYFGFGSATFPGEHQDAIWQAHTLRVSLQDRNIPIPSQFHAKDDSWETRREVFTIINEQNPRFHATFLRKENAFDRVKQRGKERLYKQALFYHLRNLCVNYFEPNDHLYVVLATFGSKKLKEAAQDSLADIAAQMPQQITPCYWDANSAWGLQAADYLTWGVQRHVLGKPPHFYSELIAPLVEEAAFPWG